MSDDGAMAGPAVAMTANVESADPKPRYKSWRKKYRKMKARFDDMMKSSSTMFKEEQKLEALSIRLQEQNDQLLDLLLELNSSLQVPHTLRYDVAPPAGPHEFDGVDFEAANNMLMDAHQAVQMGHYPQADFLQIRQDLEQRLAMKDVVKLANLEAAIPHAAYDPDKDNIPEHLVDTALQSGFLTSQHEEEYLLRMDAKLGDQWSLEQPRPVSPTNYGAMTARELEREVELKNPVSVHNWLRKHNVSVAEGDAASEAGAPATTGGKRRNLAKKVGDRAVERAREREDGSPLSSVVGARTDQDMLDDELGYADETPSSAGKAKKVRNTDDAYRPKGGRSGKAKRKREDGESNGGKGKKARTSTASIGPADL